MRSVNYKYFRRAQKLLRQRLFAFCSNSAMRKRKLLEFMSKFCAFVQKVVEMQKRAGTSDTGRIRQTVGGRLPFCAKTVDRSGEGCYIICININNTVSTHNTNPAMKVAEASKLPRVRDR